MKETIMIVTGNKNNRENIIKRMKEKEMRKDGLTYQEGIVMDNLVNAWNEYLKLSKQHPSDLGEFNDGIHKCQHALMIRVLRRDYPEGYPIKS